MSGMQLVDELKSTNSALQDRFKKALKVSQLHERMTANTSIHLCRGPGSGGSVCYEQRACSFHRQELDNTCFNGMLAPHS